MKYIVLRSFKSYDKYLKKGTIVDATEVRNPKLRISEKKIYPVVPSSNTVEPPVDVQKTSTGTRQEKEGLNIKLSFEPSKNLSLG